MIAHLCLVCYFGQDCTSDRLKLCNKDKVLIFKHVFTNLNGCESGGRGSFFEPFLSMFLKIRVFTSKHYSSAKFLKNQKRGGIKTTPCRYARQSKKKKGSKQINLCVEEILVTGFPNVKDNQVIYNVCIWGKYMYTHVCIMLLTIYRNIRFSK